jgi:hypothetical protein
MPGEEDAAGQPQHPGVEHVLPADADEVLGSDGDGRGERGHPERVAPEQQGEPEPGDERRAEAAGGEPQEPLAGPLHAAGRGQQHGRHPRLYLQSEEGHAQGEEAAEEGDLEVSRVAREQALERTHRPA